MISNVSASPPVTEYDLKVSRKGEHLILTTHTARIVLLAKKWRDVVDAIQEVSIDNSDIRHRDERPA